MFIGVIISPIKHKYLSSLSFIFNYPVAIFFMEKKLGCFINSNFFNS